MKKEIFLIDHADLIMILSTFDEQELEIISRFNNMIEEALHKEEKDE